MITPQLAQVIREAIEDRLLDVHVALPGAVQKWYPVTQTADIELQVRRPLQRLLGGYTTEELPVLPSVPVVCPRAGGHFLSFPIEKGATGLVIFCEASIDQWRSLGDVASPGEVGRHTLSAGVFFPGLAPTQGALAEDLSDAVFGAEGGTQVRSKGATVEVTSLGCATADDFVAMAKKVDENFQRIADVFAAWTPVPQDGGAALKTAWQAAFAVPQQATASKNLKAD